MKRTLLLICMAIFSIRAMAGQGFFLEFKMSSGEKLAGELKSYYLDGNTRSEMTMDIPGIGSNTSVSLVLKNAPDTVFTLNEKAKTYSATAYGKKALDNLKDQDYEVTVLGKEKLNGYNCTHVKVIYKASGRESEMWTTKDIKDYASFANVKNKYLEGGKLFKTLEEKNAGGFPARILSKEGKGQVQIDLVKAEKQDMDVSLFSLAGYTQTTAASPGGERQEMMKKIQSMTPEERQKYLEELKQKYQQQRTQPK